MKPRITYKSVILIGAAAWSAYTRTSTSSKSKSRLREVSHLRIGQQVGTSGSSGFLRDILSYADARRRYTLSLLISYMVYQDGPKVLHDISFHIKSGERVGVGECS